MKRHTRLLVLLLLAALLTGCGSKAQQPKEADAAVQTALPPEGITALTLSDDTQVLRFRRDGDIWYWQDDETFPLDQAAMPALLEAAAAMTSAPAVPAGDDLSAYGLDDAKTSLSVTADGENITLTYKEFELLSYLVRNRGSAISRDRLLEQVWGFSYEGETRTVDAHVKTLRQKLEAAGCTNLIHTVRGYGYKIGG